MIISYAVPAQLIRYVKATAAGTGDGSSWANASSDLQAMINASQVQQVWVATGTYKPGPAGNTDRTISFAMKSGVSILGGFAATGSPALTARNPDSFTTVLSGDIGVIGSNEDNSYHVVFNGEGRDATAVLDGVVITGGNANNVYSQDQHSGGGMYNIRCNPTITNCRFVGNSSGIYGGGMCNDFKGDPTITNCSFVGNSSGGYGGGIYNGDIANPRVSNCTFISNRADSGGGVYNDIQYSPTLVMINCSFVNNTAQQGGGIANSSGDIKLINCSFVNNLASGYFATGGGVYNEFGSSSLINCSFLNNTAEQGGGGVFNRSGSSALTNCVMSGNGAANAFNTQDDGIITVAYSLLETGTTNFTDGGNNQITDFSPFVSSTDASLNACSAAINTGNNAANSTTTDLAGGPRFVNTTIDRGAYEFQGTPNPPVAITRQPPSGSSVCAGSTVTAMVSATGTSPTYQWYKDGTSLGTAQQSATLTLTNVQTNLSGSYSVVVTGSCNSVTSTAFSLTVNPLPSAPTLVTASGYPYPAGVSSLTLSQNVGPVSLTISGCSGGMLTANGNAASSFTVSTAMTGTQTYTATCTQNGCTGPAASFQLTVVPPTLSVLHRDADYGNLTNNIIKPYLQLTNAGPQTIPYGEITVRYWFTAEGNAPPTNLAVYYAQLGAVNMNYVALPQPRQGANGYVEYRFPGGGSLGGGSNSGPIENGIQKTDGSNFDESDDYSYQANYQDYISNVHITAYRNGVIFYGQEPVRVALQTAVQVYSQARDGSTTSQVQTRVELRNTGNVALPVANLKLRYYFTSDNGQAASVFVDYADMGANNVQARVVRLPAPVSGADSYVELSFAGNPMQVNALSSLGAIDFRLVRSDYGLFDQNNDYSYAANYGNGGLNDRITVLLNNTLIFGTPPSGALARVMASEPVEVLSVRVLGNPVTGPAAQIEIRGAEGRAVNLRLVDLQGKALHEQRIEQAGETESVSVPLDQSRGTLLLKVSTDSQQQAVKIVRP